MYIGGVISNIKRGKPTYFKILFETNISFLLIIKKCLQKLKTIGLDADIYAKRFWYGRYFFIENSKFFAILISYFVIVILLCYSAKKKTIHFFYIMGVM